ncbi:MAG: alpha-glucuronidase family glycosyl hydrolase, partial [Acidobacteria bacterium]|nr:alpha-glucuronidase family glycosyl hydrolase [Acidobacteriota bacterium]
MIRLICLLLLPTLLTASPQLAQGGHAQAVIVTGESEFDHFAAREIQRYVEKLSGARLEVVSASRTAAWKQAPNLVVVGETGSNTIIRDATARKQVTLEGLAEDGYVLSRIQVEGKPALLVAGTSEAATLYAAYDLLERMGCVFLLTKDIVPPRRQTLALPDVNERVSPTYRRRGVHVDFCYPNQTTWSLEYWKQFLDRMARMRMNYLQVFWFPYAPLLSYEYRGERNFLGDVSTKESGYLLWAVNFGSHLAKDMVVGREHFKQPRLAPPELQNVQTTEEAFAKSQELLRQVIAYAKSRKIRTWLAIDPVSLPANLARHARA